MGSEFDTRPGQEQFWLKRAETSYSMIQTWGALVFKMLTALHSGLLVTMAALYTDTAREFGDMALAESSMFVAIVGLLLTVIGLMSAYFNGLYHFPEADARLKSLWKPDPEQRSKEADRGTRMGRWVNWLLWVAIVFVVFSTVAFFCGVFLAFLSL